jgi:hypothetical protein
VIAAPSWCPAAIQPNMIGARALPNASVASFTVGGTVAIQSRPYQIANTRSPVSPPPSANGRKTRLSPRRL